MKARFVSESIEFQRGGSDQTIKDKILGRLPKGSLYLTWGKFPYLYMLIGNASPDAEEAEFLNIGHFSGGGGKKTRFRFSARGESYTSGFRYLKKDFSPRQWGLIQDAVWTDSDGQNSWDRIEEESGIRPILPMNETIRFERGASDADIKRELRAEGPIQPGEIIVRDFNTNPHVKKLNVYVEYNPKGYLAPHKVYSFGHIDRATGEASFIHNIQNLTGQGSIQNDTFRRANREEAKEIRKALQSGRYDRYIEEAKKKTGLTPFV